MTALKCLPEEGQQEEEDGDDLGAGACLILHHPSAVFPNFSDQSGHNGEKQPLRSVFGGQETPSIGLLLDLLIGSDASRGCTGCIPHLSAKGGEGGLREVTTEAL